MSIRGAWIWFVAAGWLAAAAVGGTLLMRYEATPGPAGAVSEDWPARSGVPRAAGRFTLLLFAHPRCPCTRASLEQLRRILESSGDQTAACVLFVRPATRPEGWEREDLWRQAARIPGVRVVADGEGAEAGRFDVRTSGHALLYDPRGRLCFSGGITAGRGQAGDGPGAEAIQDLVRTGAAGRRQAPVFGCPLLESRPQSDKEFQP